MEHIEKALARAREIRANQPGGAARVAGSNSGASFSTGFTAAANAKAPPSVHGATPDYSETAIVQSDMRRTTEQRIVADDFRNPVADVYRLLRSQVLQRMKKLNMTTLAVTGAREGDGATTTAANLAISIALDVNQTVLLVDLNLREPSLHRKFGLQPAAGIEDYLRDECSLKDCLINPGLARLVVLPARASKGDAAELIVSPRMTALAKELRTRYADRIIIFDTPPLLESGETLGFLPNVDGVLFVARSGQTTKAEVDRAAELLRNYHIVGTMLNAG
jgi:Mrp family chromosome partitioning ATPase